MTNNELAGHILAAIQRHILHSAEVSARTARHEGELGHIRSAVGHWEGARKRRECAEMVSRIPARVVGEAMGEATAYAPWKLSEAGAKEMRRVLDPNDPAGKPTMPIRAAVDADAAAGKGGE